MSFTRTPGGLSEKWRFYIVPTIWVEGSTDMFFYEPIIHNISCRMEAFHGIENASALIEALVEHDYPFLVILDGDYGILKRRRRLHDRILVLSRYSFENYLWEGAPINMACLRHARCGDRKDLVKSELDRVASHLKSQLAYALVLDVAARRSSPSPAVLPGKSEPLMIDNERPEIDPVRVAGLVAAAESVLSPEMISLAKTDVDVFLKKRCITHLLNGHFIFGVLRRVFIRAAAMEGNINANMTNDALAQILSEMVWRECRSNDHKKLKKALQTTVRKLVRKYPVKTCSA